MARFLRSSARVHRLLITTGLLVPVLLFAGAAWKSWTDALHEGDATVLNAVAILGDSLHDQLQTEEFVLAEVADHLRGLDWNDIENSETNAFLTQLQASFVQIAAIWIADREGMVRAASRAWRPDTRIVEQAFFEIGQHGSRYVSAVFTGQSTQPVSLAVIQRRVAPDGEFDGTIHVELSPTYLAHLFAEAMPTAHDVLMMGANGEVLGGPGPQRGLGHLGAGDSLMRHIAAQPRGGVFSGSSTSEGHKEELYSYEQVPGYSVWVSLAVDRAAILRSWYTSLEIYGAAAVAASFALLTASWIAIRGARAEQTAFLQLQAETERRLHTERRLREAHRLEAVGQLAGGIAHDFNNLLGVITGSLDLIGRAGGANEQLQVLVFRARHAAERGARLTWSLLSFARRQVMQTDTVDVNLLLSGFLPVIQQTLGETIGAELRLCPDLPTCRADSAQLEAALLNVAINARDAMQDGGTLTITTRPAQLDRDDLADNREARPGSFVAVSLIDTGSGMPQEVMAKAFEPFFTTKQTSKGAGLGLSQVLGFVRQLGGHVTIESAVGHGTVVTLFLPQA
jgi:two-component system NtrC family sensor kinase